jgi:FlaA1/EpsC-like NDP-sugar epimerase
MSDTPAVTVLLPVWSGVDFFDTELYIDNAKRMIVSRPKVLIFGTGQYCKEFYAEHADTSRMFEVVAFVDNDETKVGQRFFDRPIVAPEAIPTFDYEYMLISTRDYYEEVHRQLMGTGAPPEKVFALEGFGLYYRQLTGTIRELCAE